MTCRISLLRICLILNWSLHSVFISVATSAESGKPLPTSFVPDANTVTRHGSAWRFPQEGWHVVHIEGTPYERGYQHGRLLAREIADYCLHLAKIRSAEAPDKAWRDLRLFVNALFLRRFDNEYLKEMQGIADGAAAAGAKLDGRLLDLIDIAVINADIEIAFLESAIEVTATGIDREVFRGRHGSPLPAIKHERCSAFIATGPATADGKIVAGHVTMSDLYNVPFFNVWLDIQPSTGHRITFQTFPGSIQSGMDYYITSGGMIISETTIKQTKFNPQGEMLASRIRRAAQYASSIDQCVQILTSSNNGLYTNEWLIGDIKSNEIAMFELGTEKMRLWRSSRNEWVGGTTGFYWGCNNVKDVGVYQDTVADVGGKPANLVLRPRIRDEAWIKLFQKRRGSIDQTFGFEAFSTAPLIGFPTCDAKFTTADMAKDLKTWAKFGPPLGRTWTPSTIDRGTLPSVSPLIANDWTLIDVQNVELRPAKSDTATGLPIVDLEPFPKKDDPLDVKHDAMHPFAWRGTLLPKTDADIWLAAAFAEYEKVVSLEHAITFHEQPPTKRTKELSAEPTEKLIHQSNGSPKDQAHAASQAGRDLIDLALFQHESRWLTAVRRTGQDTPLAKIRSDHANGDWYRIAVGKGVMFLAALRAQLGDEPFVHCLDTFGQAHAGQEITTEQFRTHLKSEAETKALATLDHWLSDDVSSEFQSKNPWTIFSHEVEPERVLVVYGTKRDNAAQQEAARHLQSEVARRFANLPPAVKSDQEITDADLKSHYLLLVGQQETNHISARCLDQAKTFPVQFGTRSFHVANETYAHPDSWVIAAGQNPFNPRYSMVVFAGLSAAATWHSVRDLIDSDIPDPQIILHTTGKQNRMFRLKSSK